MKYHIHSTSPKGNFALDDEEHHELFKLKYENWFSSKANAQTSEHQYIIKSRNIWWTKFDVFREGRDIGDLSFNWKGNVVIRLLDKRNMQRVFILRGKGIWGAMVQLVDENSKQIFSLKPDFKWSKFNYSYELDLEPDIDPDIDIVELLICCGYAVNLYMSRISTTTVSKVPSAASN